MGQYKALRREKEALEASSKAKCDALQADAAAAAKKAAAERETVVGKTRELVARYKASQAELRALKDAGAAGAGVPAAVGPPPCA